MEKVIPFKKEKETKRTFRYREVDEEGNFKDILDADVGTIYIKKTILGPNPSEIIQVIIQWE